VPPFPSFLLFSPRRYFSQDLRSPPHPPRRQFFVEFRPLPPVSLPLHPYHAPLGSDHCRVLVSPRFFRMVLPSYTSRFLGPVTYFFVFRSSAPASSLGLGRVRFSFSSVTGRLWPLFPFSLSSSGFFLSIGRPRRTVQTWSVTKVPSTLVCSLPVFSHQFSLLTALAHPL